MSDKDREEFEAWYADHFRCARGVDCSAEIIASMREGDLYGDRGYLNGCWIGWKASRAALVIDVPDENDDRFWSQLDDPNYGGNSHIFLEGTFTDAVHEAIESAGVRVKP